MIARRAGLAALLAAPCAAALAQAPEMVEAPEMLEVPAGPFTMGSDDGPDDERPAHQVSLTAFRIDRLPVTNAEFAAFLDAQGQEGGDGARRYLRNDDDDADARIRRVGNRWRADPGRERHPSPIEP